MSVECVEEMVNHAETVLARSMVPEFWSVVC